ncbi:MAG: MmgE/PrpD family protein [Thermodesulfobacteriota bacterium]|nr:MmgE/PrpD family protein [Thermodesulfobacteriota bacterium]
MAKTTSILADFIAGIRFDDLPYEVIEQTRKILIDSIGCALEGLHTRKGNVCLSFARNAGGSPEATIIGIREKAPAPLASFVNGELLTALDYDALCAPFGHITPFVLSAPLAVAEWKKVCGRDLIVSIALAHEIAQRICMGLKPPAGFFKETAKRGMFVYPPIHGYGVNIFGGIAGVVKILEFDPGKIEHAFGTGGYMCPVPTLLQFAEAVPSSMSKFSPSGWISQAQVTAALLAGAGYIGDKNVLDGDFAFWKSFAADGWDPGQVSRGLGTYWFLPDMVGFKRYPCCGAMHGALDVFYAIIDKFNIQPEDINELNVVLNLLAELSLWKNRKIANHIDAQFSTAYVFSVAAHRIEIGHKWQVEETYNDRAIIEFMGKVNISTPASPEHEAKRHIVEVVVEDKETGKEKRYTERDVWPVNSMVEDEELFDKFRRNGAGILPTQAVEKALEILRSLEELDDIGDLMELFSV